MSRRVACWLGCSLGVLTAGACRREERVLPGPKPVAILVAKPPSEPKPSVSALMLPSDQTRKAHHVLRSWNDALNRHDADRLATHYAETVRFYGRRLARKTVVAAKRAAFTKQPGFFQELIGEAEFSQPYDDALSVSFHKKTGEPDDFEVVAAKLVLSKSDAGTFTIVEETDEASSRAEEAARERCKTTVMVAVNRLPEVVRALANIWGRTDGEKARSGDLGPYYDHEGGVFGALGIHTDERFEEEISYSVREGVLRVTVLGTESAVSDEVQRKVKQACPP